MTNQSRMRNPSDASGTNGQPQNPKSALVRASLSRFIDTFRRPLRDHAVLMEQRNRLGRSQIMGHDVTVETLHVLDALAESRQALLALYAAMEPPACVPETDRWSLGRVTSNTLLSLRHEARHHEADRAAQELLRPFGGQSSRVASSRADDSPQEEARVLAVYTELGDHLAAKTAWCGLATDALGQACTEMDAVIERWGLSPLLT